MVDPRAYPVFQDTTEYARHENKELKSAIELIKQKVNKTEFNELNKADYDTLVAAANALYKEQAPKPAQPPAPGSVPEPAAPTQELNQSYKDEEPDPLRVENLFRPDYNKKLQELIKRKLDINVKIEDPEIETEYQSLYSITPPGSPKVFDEVPIIKLKAIYPWGSHEDIEIDMRFRKDLIFTNVLSNYFPQLNDFNTSLSVGARVALRLALILGKLGKELQKLDGDFGAVANTLGINIKSYTTHMRWHDWE